MVLGQSAATAACHAIDEKVTVQNIDIEKLQARLIDDKQVLKWTGPRRKQPLRVARMEGVAIDDTHVTLTGTWKTSSAFGGFVEKWYLHDGNENKGEMKATFQPKIEKAGRYEVRLYFLASSNRATNVPVTIESSGDSKTVLVNQRKKPKTGAYVSLGTFTFPQGKVGITISNEKTDGHVIVDAVQLMPVK